MTRDTKSMIIFMVASMLVIGGIISLCLLENHYAIKNAEERLLEKIPNTEHQLIALNQYSGDNAKIEGSGHSGLLSGYFSITGNSRTTSYLRFAWKPIGNEMLINEVPITKTKIIINENIVIPTIRFWMYIRLSDKNVENIQGLLDNSLIYATITTPSKYWNVGIGEIGIK